MDTAKGADERKTREVLAESERWAVLCRRIGECLMLDVPEVDMGEWTHEDHVEVRSWARGQIVGMPRRLGAVGLHPFEGSARAGGADEETIHAALFC